MIRMCIREILALTLLALMLTVGPAAGAMAGTEIQVSAPFPAPSGVQFKEEWLGFTLVAVLVVAAIAMAIVAWLQKKSLRKRLRLELRNLGNVPSRYELQAKDPDGALRFQLTLNGDGLEQRQVFEAGQVTPEAKTEQPPPSSSTVNMEGVRQTAGGAMRISGAIADLLNSVGMMLPPSVRAPLLRASSQLRRGRSTVRRTEQFPDRMARRMRVASTSKAKARPEAKPVSPKVVSTWVQTPFVEPGETLAVDLFIRPVKSRQDEFYPFKVLSRSVEQEEAPLVIEEGSVQIAGASRFRRYSPYLLILVIAVVILFFAFFLASAGVLGQ